MKKKKPKGIVAEARAFCAREKLVALAVALALVNLVALMVLSYRLGGDAMGGFVENGRYFVGKASKWQGGAVWFTEVSRADFNTSLVMDYLWYASLLCGFVYACVQYFKDERALKARRAAAIEVTLKRKPRR